jgi:hypothetical protein
MDFIEYRRTHSLMKPHDGPTRQDIINSVYKQMQIIRINFEYETVRKFVSSYLDRIGFKDTVCNEYNPDYTPGNVIMMKNPFRIAT